MSTSKEVPSQGTLFDTSVSWSSTEPYSIPRIVFGGQPSAGILDSAERSEAVAGPVSIDSARLVIALLDDISQKRRLQGLVIADPRSVIIDLKSRTTRCRFCLSSAMPRSGSPALHVCHQPRNWRPDTMQTRQLAQNVPRQ